MGDNVAWRNAGGDGSRRHVSLMGNHEKVALPGHHLTLKHFVPIRPECVEGTIRRSVENGQ